MASRQAGHCVPGDTHRTSLRNRFSLFALIVAGAMASACGPAISAGQQSRDLKPICLSNGEFTAVLNVEVAKTPSQRRKGLQHRRGLPADQGMLFSYTRDQPVASAFWMYQTPTPLSIAFLDHTGVIINIVNMAPCVSSKGSECALYKASRPYRYALEANAGYFQQHQFSAGDRVDLNGLADCNPEAESRLQGR